MKIKPRHKRRFFWTIVVLLGLAIISIVCIPPFINLNNMKPMLEQKLYEQTGIDTKINGNINFSLLGSATIVAHNIQIPTGSIGSISFSIPLNQIFNLKNATLNKDIGIHNANIKITELFPGSISHNINIYNTSLDFMNHDYKIIRGTLSNNSFTGQIRTGQHKYDITYKNGEFVILNINDNLHIRGTLFQNGGASGEMSITTDDINKWFEFQNPKINEPVSLSMNFIWDGEYGFDFTNIKANNYTGTIQLFPTGINAIDFKSNNANIDISFITTDKNMLNKTDINLDLKGRIKFNQNVFSTVILNAIGRDNTLHIKHFITDNIELFGGTYNNSGLHNTQLKINNLPEKFNCEFSGTQTKWNCNNFVYGNISGNITNDNGIFKITATSTNKMPSLKTIRELVSHIGESGTIDFTFSDMAGQLVITKQQIIPKFSYAQNIALSDLDFDLKFLPKHMLSTMGTYTIKNNKKTFISHNKQWMIDITGNNFTITGNNFKQWFPGTDLRFIQDSPYVISGTYNNHNVGDLNIMIAGQLLSGNASKSGITLKIPELNLDKFISQSYKDNYPEQKFLSNHPLAILFELPIHLSLSADTLIFNNQEYKNFVYSLKPDTQVFSISDSARGHMLGIIEKKKFNYDISIQLNKFKLDKKFLSFDSPVNISNSTITAEITLHTSGQTANDLIYNLSGDVDMTFIGGTLYGFGFDDFYASAENINILNAEYAVKSALESGSTQIKKLKIQGVYNNGNFETTKPFTLSLRNVEGTGNLSINNKIVTGTFEFIMRGVALYPVSLDVIINEQGKRNYPIHDILDKLDIGYMHAYIKSKKSN